jgi:subtilisin family serine protease
MVRNFFRTGLSLATILGVVFSFTGAVVFADTEDVIIPSSERKIVIFKDLDVAGHERTVLHHRGIHVKHLVGGKAEVAILGKGDVERLSRDPRVLRIEDDIIVEAVRNRGVIEGRGVVGSAAVQILPWGIDRVDADRVWTATSSGSKGLAVKVAVIDTGIQLNHPDLVNRVKGGLNAINHRKSYADDNGHGTHVAGIIAANDNTTGVIGAAPLASLYAVKVLDRNGSGYLSDIIEGIDWSIVNKMQVINMSLGASMGTTVFHDAVIRARNAGITIVAASGNDGGAVLYPAAYPEVVAVAATDNANTIAYWSNHGSEVDIAAPGVSIYSTYLGSTYATLSGTSMATPHVVGTVALLLALPVGGSDVNGNGKWDPDEIVLKLKGTARDLGAVGVDDYYGAGLIDAYMATR